MNGNWSDYQINQLHRQSKMREAEQHRCGQVAEGKSKTSGNRLTAVFASLWSLLA